MVAKNNASNVSVGQGVQGGYFSSAPLGTELPTDYSTELPEAFVGLGFITQDGIEFGYDGSSSDYYDLNGDVYETSDGTQSETVNLTMAEIKAETMKEVHGQDNVTDSENMTTVKHNSIPVDERIFVFDLLLKNGRKWRSVVPRGKVSRNGSTTVSKSNIVGLPISIKCLPNENGDRIIDYIENKATASMAMSRSTLVSQANELGITVPAKANKEQIIELIQNAESAEAK